MASAMNTLALQNRLRGDLGEQFNSLNTVRHTLNEISDLLDNASDIIAESSVERDKETVRDNARTKISEFKRRRIGLKTSAKQIDELRNGADDLKQEIAAWFEKLRTLLGGSDLSQALLWVGLGQAGVKFFENAFPTQCQTFLMHAVRH